MNEAKQARIAAAEKAKEEKRLRETNDLSVAFLRAQSALLIFADEFAALRAIAPRKGQVLPVPLDRFEPTQATRAAAMVFFFYASLNVVVEGWRDKSQATPRLVDRRIDELLQSEHVATLADFRNAVLHPNSIVDNRILKFHANHVQLKAWADELCSELARFFREWREAVGFAPQNG